MAGERPVNAGPVHDLTATDYVADPAGAPFTFSASRPDALLVVYFGYISLIAFNKPFLAQPIGAGVTSLGVPIGMGVIVFTIAITVFYVRIANNKFDALTEEIMKDVTK